MTPEIGFMQGRLSPHHQDRIQAFPWNHWREEVALAGRLHFPFLEWTLDREGLDDNPLMTDAGRDEICRLMADHGVAVPSLTGDCFMQAPFHQETGAAREALLGEFERIVEACGELGIGAIVLPLVDGGRLRDRRDEDSFNEGLSRIGPNLEKHTVRILIESNYPPAKLAHLIAPLPANLFGINYDTGNSAALGHDPAEELAAYGERIGNVHLKDRLRGGHTVPLGEGDADFAAVFGGLARARYGGRFVLQTARAADGDHADALCRYRDFARAALADARAAVA